MIKPPQNDDFPCHKLDTLTIKIIKSYFFQSNNFIMSYISSLVNITISSLANLQKEDDVTMLNQSRNDNINMETSNLHTLSLQNNLKNLGSVNQHPKKYKHKL